MRSSDASSAASKAVVVAIVAGTVALYAHTIGRPFVWDDRLQIADNPSVTEGAPLAAYFLDRSTTTASGEYNDRVYRPLRNLVWRGVAKTVGVTPAAFHVANLLLYALSIPLVWLLVWRAFGDRAAAHWATALWAVMPVHVEPAVYACGLGDLLSLVLELAGVLCALAAWRDERRWRALAAASWAAMLGALFAKEMAITAIALLALWALLEGARNRRVHVVLAGHTLLLLGYLALRTAVIGRVGQEATTGASFASGIQEAPRLLLEYARVTVAVLGHNTSYFVAFPTAMVLVAAVLAIAAAVAGAWFLDRRWQAPPGLRLGLGWFAVSLLPVLHLVPIWAHVADRFALVPSVGFALVLGWGARALARTGRPRLVAALATPLLALYALGTLLEQAPWSSDEALWTHATAEAPRSGMAHFNLARVYMSQGRFEPALEQMDHARGGDAPNIMWVWRATALDGVGRTEDARRAATEAVRTNPQDPAAHALLGDLLRRAGDLAGARTAWQRAHALAPTHPSTRLLEAGITASEGHLTEAAAIYADVAAHLPTVARFRYQAASAALDAGDLRAASRQAEACLAIEPDQPQCTKIRDEARRRAVATPATR